MLYGDLSDRFRTANVDQSELEQILLAHFGASAGISPREIHYTRPGTDQPALILRYDSDGELESIEDGSALREQDVLELEEKIHRLLLIAAGTAIGQTILFAHLPTNGWFRYRHLFQLSPVPPEAPRPPYTIGDHPLLLQYTFPDSEDFQIRIQRRTRVGREIELLCVALTTSIWKGASYVVSQAWVLPDITDAANWRSRFLQELYTYPGANGLATAFSDVEGVPVIARTDPVEYYGRRGITADQVLDLPANFGDLLDRFFALSRMDRDRFLRAAFWFQHAQRVANLSRSASFTALVSAIEALMPPQGNATACSACGRPFTEGPTKRFVDFVERFVPDANASRSERRKLYSLRSALSHGGALLHSDRYGWMAGMTSKSLDEWSDHDAMWRIVRLALVNWLLARPG